MKYEARIGERTAKVLLLDNVLHFWCGGDCDAAAEVTAEFTASALAPGACSVLLGERSFEVAIGSENQIIVNGHSYPVEVFDPREMRGARGAAAGEGRQQIKAMMPGKVVRLLVKQGDSVEAGQGVIVVEAMKMQNEMKSPRAGRVAEIKAKADSTVAAGEVLLVIE